MNHKIQDNVLTARVGLGKQRLTIAKRFELPPLLWQKALLFIVFGLLLQLVISECTGNQSPFVAVALVAVLAVGSIAVLRPRFALLLVFIGAGLPALLLPIPGHTVRPVELTLFLCLLVIVLRRPHLRLRLPHLLALLFVAIVIISFIHVPEISTDVNTPGADKRLYQLILMFAAFFCASFLVKYVKDVSSFLVTVLLCNIPLYLIGLAQALNVHLSPPLVASGGIDAPGGRLYGPFNGAVGFGIYLDNLLAVALACWLLGTRRSVRTIGALMTVASALGIVGSGTRSAGIAAIIVVIIAFALTRRFKMLLATLTLAGAAATIFFTKIQSLFTHDSADNSNRLFVWQEAIKLITTHPLIGIGLTQFRVYYAQLVVSQSSQLGSHGISVHQQYLEWAMESGILWLIVGVLLLLSITYSCWQAYHLAQRKQQVLLLATILAMLANMIIGFFDVPLDGVESTVVLFLLAGLALGYAERIRWGTPGYCQLIRRKEDY